MSALVQIHALSKSHGTQSLFENIFLSIQEGDRIGLVGPNGAGKSTLLKLLTGQEPADSGSITRRQGLRIGYASQMPEFADKSVEEILTDLVPDAPHRAHIALSLAEFSDFSQKASALSGGWKKRLDIARALLLEPDLLLLDEPTNHLDLEGITWLEKRLLKERCAAIIISHDRYFLEHVATKIVDLNRCYPEGIFCSSGPYSTYLERKKQFLDGQTRTEQSLSSIVSDEISWLKRSPKARTTKSQARVQKTHELIDELNAVQERNTESKVRIDFEGSERETRKLLVGKNLAKSYGGKLLFSGLDITLSPALRVGIMGKNGTGKTSLLKILAGQIQQDMGTVKYADNLSLVYFDQHREEVPEQCTLKDALSPLGDFVTYRGVQIHVNGWAKKFLFRPERLSLPVRLLSGGERARILLARLMLQPADILFLDEPTNDLDIQTLEVFEESLQEFPGACVLISHDRCLVDRICNQIIGLQPDAPPSFFADYSQWQQAELEKKDKTDKPSKQNRKEEPKPTQKKLSYKEQKELEGMQEAIMRAEEVVAQLQKELENNPSAELYTRLADAQQKIDYLFDRWQELSIL